MKGKGLVSQSAMEYLMTYGWAILIIAVVLAALFELGVFNNTNLGPRAQPGSCHVFRPDGPGTTSFINTEGVCNGEMPEYVASFNGQSSYVSIPAGVYFEGNTLTVAGWVNTAGYGSWERLMDFGIVYNNGGLENILFAVSQGTTGQPLLQVFNGTYRISFGTTQVPLNSWVFLVSTYNGTQITMYENGAFAGSGAFSLNAAGVVRESNFIGRSNWAGDAYFSGDIANVQFYNSSLSANEVELLYQKGIGGAPIDLPNLVGWWPLNGNAQDYSGNNDNGAPTNVIFTGQWTSGYTTP